MNQGFTKFQGMIVIHSELRINSLGIHTFYHSLRMRKSKIQCPPLFLSFRLETATGISRITFQDVSVIGSCLAPKTLLCQRLRERFLCKLTVRHWFQYKTISLELSQVFMTSSLRTCHCMQKDSYFLRASLPRKPRASMLKFSKLNPPDFSQASVCSRIFEPYLPCSFPRTPTRRFVSPIYLEPQSQVYMQTQSLVSKVFSCFDKVASGLRYFGSKSRSLVVL